MTAAGSRPAGADNEVAAAQAVREMFDSIAPRYDLLNHILSASVDRLWWWQTARRFKPILANPDAQILDICCGTGHMTMALLKGRPRGARPILAADFSRGMLAHGAERFEARRSRGHGTPYAIALEADALHLPLRDASLDLVVTAFGFRNLANYEAGLREFNRVLKPGGQLGILDFSEPGGLIGKAYALYFHRILPTIAGIIGGKGGAYRYLPTSVGNFPPPEEMIALMKSTGYAQCAWQPYTFCIAGLYTGVRGQ
jgi:demethylmenaquinone methyltransferase/2-methoxy-6-polyprenyl-1,4-benzoquinol methylase